MESGNSRLTAARKELEEVQALLEEKSRVEVSLREEQKELNIRLEEVKGMVSCEKAFVIRNRVP